MNPIKNIGARLPDLKPRHWMTLVVLFWAYFFLIALTFSLFWPFKTGKVVSPVKVENKTVEAGKEIILHLEYCKYREGPVTIQRQMVDGFILSLPDVTSNLPTGCRTSEIRVSIPETTVPGVYHFNYTAVYKINDLRHIYKSFHTESFTVTNKNL